MAGIYIELSDELAAKATERGLMTNEVFERVLRRELTVTTEIAHAKADGDDGRYMEGYELGMRWVKDASFEEISEIALWKGEPWRQFSIDPTTHTLPAAICHMQGLEEPQGTAFWLERTPFVEGLLDAVGEMWRNATG